MSDVEATPTATREELLQARKPHAAPAHGLLVALRERERTLSKVLRATPDAGEAAALHAELDAIAQCKVSLKANVKRETKKASG